MARVVTPGSTSMVRFALSNSRILSIRTVHMTMQLGDGTLPPLNPVPEPRVTTSMPSRLASFRIWLTCCALVTNTTQPGNCEIAAVPSKLYVIKSSGFERTFCGPTICFSSDNGGCVDCTEAGSRRLDDIG